MAPESSCGSRVGKENATDPGEVLKQLQQERQSFQRMCERWLGKLSSLEQRLAGPPILDEVLEGSRPLRFIAGPPEKIGEVCEPKTVKPPVMFTERDRTSEISIVERRHSADATGNMGVQPCLSVDSRHQGRSPRPHSAIPARAKRVLSVFSHNAVSGSRRTSERSAFGGFKKKPDAVTAWSLADSNVTSNEYQAQFQRIFGSFNLGSRIQPAATVFFGDVEGFQKNPRSRILLDFVHGNVFSSVSYTLVILNAIHIGVSAEIGVRRGIAGVPVDDFITYTDIAFSVWFIVELLLRLLAERLTFFLKPNVKWNVLDSVLVSFAIADLAMASGTANIAFARIIRLVRFARLFRLAYAVRAFTSLRVIVLGILDSALSLSWCFMIVAFILYVFAVFFMQCVTEHYVALRGASEDEVAVELRKFYGGMKPAMETLFMTITGGVDWWEPMKPLADVHWAYEVVFIFFIFFMFFAVLNVVIGTFVATTTEVQHKDRDTQVRMQMKRFQNYANKLKEFFHEADTDNSGRLTWEEFSTYLQNPRVKAYFQSLDLDLSQADDLFKILDSDGVGDIGLDDFVTGCMWLKNQAKSLDIRLLMFQNERITERLNRFIHFAEERFLDLDACLSGFRPDLVNGEAKRPTRPPRRDGPQLLGSDL